MSDDLLGQLLGPYEIVDAIGFEGPAEVYRGYHHETGKHVLIRVVGRGMEANTVWNARFRREGRAIAALKHANIAPAYDFGEAMDGHYMVSETPEGMTLSKIMEQVEAGERTLEPDDITFMIRQVAAALDYAHRQGVTHRDLTPSHIIITRSGQAIVTDFGLATLLSRDAADHTGGAYFGAADYMAPEVLEDFLSATHASDIYSLGVILYQIITGELPYEVGSDVDDVLRILTGTAPDPRLLNPDIPVTVAEVVIKALSVSPKDRFKNTMQMAAQLEWAYANPVPQVDKPRRRKAPKPGVESTQPITGGPLSSPRRPTAERLVVKRSLSWQEERKEKARLRAEHNRIRREEEAKKRQIQHQKTAKKRQAQREKRRAFWKRWGQAIVTLGIVLVILIAVVVGLQIAGVIAIKLPSLPALPKPPEPATPVPTSTPFDAEAASLALTPSQTPVLTPTPISPTQTPIAPVAVTPIEIGTAAFRAHDGAMMQFIPAGQFLMGTDDPARHANAHPQHPVMLADYWIDHNEVTNAQYALCVERGLCQAPSQPVYFDNPAYANYPVTFVTYEQAAAYCLWLASTSDQVIGLPTEAQWEKAAAWDPATNTARLYPWGDEYPTAEQARFFGGQDSRPASPVGIHPEGASAYDVQDMAGNVWEWVADWFDPDYYKRTGVAVDPTGPLTGTERITRGGSWRNEAYMLTSSARNPTRPTTSGDSTGFRCAMTVGHPPAESSVVLTSLDAAQALSVIVQQAQNDSRSDADTMESWLTALSDLSTALSIGDNQKALGIIVENSERLPAQIEDELLTPSMAFRLENGLVWIREQLRQASNG
ncbi:MAG: SUMF1/EgtB/PvdO family nonheme iron enzyme [Anaerolineae bacterium]|nr:SUMF1/EgtB/PvdO family nonheme iron enzyme [Anaerolineae bacterium]